MTNAPRRTQYLEDVLKQRKTRPQRDLTPLYSAFQQKHNRILSMWNALDAKIGIILGFTVLVLLGITTNSDVINSVTSNTLSICSLSYVYHFIIFTVILIFYRYFDMYFLLLIKNGLTCGLFWLALASFVYATYTGVDAIRVKWFDDIPIVDEADDFINNRHLTEEILVQHLVDYLYDYVQRNEKQVLKKARAARKMTEWFLLGTLSFVVRFIVIVISNIIR